MESQHDVRLPMSPGLVLPIGAICLLCCAPSADGGGVAPSTWPRIVRVKNEPPGMNCPVGGVAVQSGIDKNADGLLSIDEVRSTVYVCSGVPITDEGFSLDGTFALENSRDVEIAAHFRSLGGLRIVDTTLTSVALPRLEAVVGDIEVGSNALLADLVLPNLSSVGAALTVSGNDVLTSLNGFPALTTLGTLVLEGNHRLRDVATLCSITSMDGFVMIVDNLELPTCSADVFAECAVAAGASWVVIQGNDDSASCP